MLFVLKWFKQIDWPLWLIINSFNESYVSDDDITNKYELIVSGSGEIDCTLVYATLHSANKLLFQPSGVSTCLNCFWRESVKPLQFYCQTPPRRLLCSENMVLVLDCPAYILKIGIAAKYDINSVYYSTAIAKNAVWSSFVNNVKF